MARNNVRNMETTTKPLSVVPDPEEKGTPQPSTPADIDAEQIDTVFKELKNPPEHRRKAAEGTPGCRRHQAPGGTSTRWRTAGW